MGIVRLPGPVAPTVVGLLLQASCHGGSAPDDVGTGGSDVDPSGDDGGLETGGTAAEAGESGIGESTSSGDDASGSGGGTTQGADTTGDSGADPGPVGIGLIQYDADAHFGDPDFNVASLTQWAVDAIARGARIIVLPEGSTYGYASASEVWCSPGRNSWYGKSCRDVSSVAETLPGGPTTVHWQAFAAEHEVYVVYHVPEVDGGRFYTSLGVVGPTGYVTRYRKRSLYYVDEAFATPGNQGVVLDTPYGKFGLMLCLDGTYNGPYYDDYKAMGIDDIIISMDWDEDPTGSSAAVTWFADRAADNDVVIYAADVSTWDGTARYPPHAPRERDGLPAVAIGVDGISFHAL